jgi:hypothetical protein
MPGPNNPATARVVLIVQRDTRKFLNVLNMARSDGADLTSADLISMANVVADWWLNSYRHTCSSAIVGDSVIASKQDPDDPLQETVYLASPGDLVGGTLDPADVSGAISWRTGFAGRKYRGRFYHFQPDGNRINANDTFQGSLISSFTSVGNYLLSHAATASLRAIVFHRSTNTYTPILTVIMDQLVDSMRRRLAGRGI